MSAWTHPRHGNLRSPNYATAHIGAILTDRKIAKYLKAGFYDQRAWYRAEVKQKRAERTAIKGLIYDCEKQDFV